MDGATGQETQTAEQRETLESGLRMLARMIARAHLRPAEVNSRRGVVAGSSGMARAQMLPLPVAVIARGGNQAGDGRLVPTLEDLRTARS